MTALAFGAPMVLWALALLPLLWWLLRATPPRPRDVSFAPTRLLLRLTKQEETAERTPWWLLLLRLAVAALVIIALAQPILRPEPTAAIGSGPMLIAVDDTFAAAADWQDRTARAERLIDEAEAANRAVILLPTSDAAAPLTAISAAEARDALAGLEAKPWHARRADLAPRIAELDVGAAAWLTDGLATSTVTDTDAATEASSDAGGADAAFAAALAAASATEPRVFAPEPGGIVGVTGVTGTGEGMRVDLTADATPGGLARTVRAVDPRGFVLAEAQARFGLGERTASVDLAMPTELRNEALRVTVAGERSAAAVRLLDERFRRRTVGLIAGTSVDLAQPLLSPLHYLRAALAPFADLREPNAQDLVGGIDELVDAGTSVIVLADVGNLLPSSQDALARWINAGGVLLRFAGPRTADGMDDLVPVEMRRGARTLGGTLSWNEEQPLAAFTQDGPFADRAVPDDVIVQRQLLAEPSIALNERTWASLADGTPLITGRNIGAGWVVFVHVTADTTWSSLPLSGIFVEMLRDIVELSSLESAERADGGPRLPPYRALDGAGRLTAPGPRVEPIDAGGPVTLGPTSPPGLYGADGAFRAVNLLEDGATLDPLNLAALDVSPLPYTADGPTELRGAFLTVAAGLLLADALAILILMGALRRGATAAIALALVLPATDGLAQSESAADRFALDASLSVRLAYVATGDAAVDRVAEAGLAGLSRVLTERTAVEPGPPMAVNIESDDLAFFPLIYWPVSAEAERPSDTAIARVDAFMKNGGTLLFDTRDQAGASIAASETPATLALRRILDGLDIPALEPVPQDHVLTKAFYLLDDFPGRWSGSPLWVEEIVGDGGSRPARAGDGVSPILITANDFAAAWAINSDGSPMFSMGSDPYQREFARRAGVNIAIYTMTGNYKADQVHIPALLERLGQ